MAEPIPVTAATPDLLDAARAVAERWGLAFGERPAAALRLVLTPEGLALLQSGPGAPGPVMVDFVGGAVGHRRRFGGGRGQPIARAAGLRRGVTPSVVDATAGLGRDAFVLASLGCPLTLIERSPVAAALLEDGLRRGALAAEVAPIVARMSLVYGDAAALLPGLRADVVYLDPMYPHRDSTALVKKEMRLFQALLGPDADSDRLLPAALAAARARVVVKRPAAAPPLAGERPTLDIRTKNHRFDVYLVRAS